MNFFNSSGNNNKKSGRLYQDDMDVTEDLNKKDRQYDDNNTIYINNIQSNAEDKTIAYFSDENGNNFVTGWLVCIDGPEKGRDYRLGYGFNSIGRNLNMKVSIRDDRTISRDNHCSIVYEDKNQEFILVPESGAITYLNNSILMKAKKLYTEDIIKIGETTLQFIEFCKKGKTW